MVFFLYWTIFKKNALLQNIFLLSTSLFFFAWADWRFLFLLILCILVNFLIGLRIYNTQKEKIKQRYLYLGLVFNIGLLFYFKYFNFFYEGFIELLGFLGSSPNYSSLSIIVPLGISFFTFQNLGYLFDVYNEEIEAEKDLLAFSLFVAYFPKILSGPIERGKEFIPQIKNHRKLSYKTCSDGFRQILWGLFAKIVIAENCADIVNPIFNNYQDASWGMLMIGLLFYTIQIYADFSGYSNMAIGVSKLLGIQLARNFATPFFATNIADFWRGWHMSLTTWMMDYVFTPLSFTLRKYKKKGLIIAIVSTFVLVGLWHGANWTFIVYGLLHGIYFIPMVYSGGINQQDKAKNFFLVTGLKRFLLLGLIAVTAIFFRAGSIDIAINYIYFLFSFNNFYATTFFFNTAIVLAIILASFYFAMEWYNRKKTHDFDLEKVNVIMRWILYIFVFVLILFFGKNSDSFIYFQF